ncbi:MAG: FGGY-family carbohydrate kinase [Clostridiaceae bacterium]|nr:FGGY-family carbohydrate kinase [Clostridiaceae bacterium]
MRRIRVQEDEMSKKYVISYDIGTTGVKTCLFEIDSAITLISAAMEGYKLYIMPDGGAEQDPDEWWNAICSTTKTVFSKCDIKPEQIEGISFCSQMQGLVLVDKDGVPVHRAFSYMDQRAKKQLKEGIAYGFKIAGANITKLIPSLLITGAVALSVKDPVWKYQWVRENEPENFKRVYKWLDVKEYIISRMTDRFVMTRDSAFATLLYDIRKGHEGWSKKICKILNVNPDHLAEIVECTDKVGGLTAKAAQELGLKPGTAVFGGGGDASLIGVGAGSVELGETHIYSGTSGWVSTVVDKSVVDTSAMIAAVLGAQKDRFNYFAELETAGKCLEWVKDHLALDEIGIFLQKTHVAESPETVYTNLYDYLSKVIDEIPAGSSGVIFTPWLHGNRCPFEDPNARGMFFNVSLDVGKTELIRSVIEGVCFHLRWFLETEDKKIQTSSVVRFVGSGALSDVTCQILADITGRTVETVDSPQNVGAVGAAVIMAVGLGVLDDISHAKKLIPAKKTFVPNAKNKDVYDRNFAVYKTLYKNNKEAFKALNG